MEHLHWTAQSLDAVRLIIIKGRVEVLGSDGEEVELEGDLQSVFNNQALPTIKERWLLVDQYQQSGDFILRLPKSKAWVLDILSYHGDIEVRDVQARLKCYQGRGDVDIEQFAGKYQIFSNKGKIRISHFRDLEVPDCPPPPAPEGFVDPQNVQEWFGGPAEYGKHFPDFFFWDEGDWSHWGNEVGEKAKVWAGQVGHHMMGQAMYENTRESHIRLVKGDLELEDFESAEMSGNINQGDLNFKGGGVKDLRFKINHGKVEINSVLPTGTWQIGVNSGDIRLFFPANTRAKLDVATRSGEIKSDIPLMRVARPGPESRRGGRMVGNLGQPAGEVTTHIDLAVSHGEIQIGLLSSTRQVRYEMGQEGENRPVIPLGPSANDPVSSNPSSEPAASSEETRLGILRALKNGEISLEEADHLLRRLAL